MKAVTCRRNGAGVLAAAALLGMFLWQSQPTIAWGLGPESPEVKALVTKALKYLETADHESVGGRCLLGLAFYKAKAAASHPKITGAIKEATRLAEVVRQNGIGANCYNEAIACIFLCEIDESKYAPEVGYFVEGLLKRQLPNGMWTYQGKNQPDTSQTQYAMLALWSAHISGVQVPLASIEKGMLWLVNTQYRHGGFCYWPAEGGPSGERSQTAVDPTLSMTVAGLGALYAGAFLHGVQRPPTKEQDLPPAVTRVRDRQNAGIFGDIQTNNLKPEMLAASVSQGKAWIAQNFGPENSDRRWTFYYLYGLERCMSLKELVEGPIEENPGWYNAVYAYLQRSQKPNGSWDAGSIPTPVDTAFGVLVLLRSMQKTIEKAALGEGVLIGGKGLPKDLTNIRMVDGQVVTPQMVRDMDDLLDLISSAEDKEFDPKSLPGGVSLDADLTKRNSQLERLREMVTNEDFAARQLAVRTLASARELDNVPALIYALTDPDARIREEARDGLRFISRRFEGFGPGEADADKAKASAARWREWYLAIRPDAQFLD